MNKKATSTWKTSQEPNFHESIGRSLDFTYLAKRFQLHSSIDQKKLVTKLCCFPFDKTT